MEKDICDTIKTLDFDKPSDLKKILFRDKHTRIEGLCTEHLFREEIINGVFEKSTSGFWFSLKNNNFNVTKFLVNVADITDLDYQVLNYFLEHKVTTWVVFFDKSEKDFYYLKYTNENKNNLDFSIKSPYPKNPKKAFIPKSSERNEDRLLQACELLNNYNSLFSSAIERTFANCWLGNGSFWDVDCFTFYKDQLIAFEVKQKYPTAKGTFGLNTGLVKLFTFLTSIGVKVIHIILTKPINDDKIPAIDFYTKDEYIDKSFWIATDFSVEILSDNTSTAPSKTSIFGNNSIEYYHIQLTKFHKLKKLKHNHSLIIEFLDKKTTNIQDIKTYN